MHNSANKRAPALTRYAAYQNFADKDNATSPLHECTKDCETKHRSEISPSQRNAKTKVATKASLTAPKRNTKFSEDKATPKTLPTLGNMKELAAPTALLQTQKPSTKKMAKHHQTGP